MNCYDHKAAGALYNVMSSLIPAGHQDVPHHREHCATIYYQIWCNALISAQKLFG